MGLLDEALRNVTSNVLNLFTDEMGSIRRRTEVYDLRTGVESSAYEKEYEVKFSPPFPYALKEIDGTAIQQGDFKLIVAAADLTIEPDPKTDWVVRHGVTYRIVKSNPIVSGDQAAAFELQCRK